MPSAYEGYGHVLHESQSTGQVLITTDAPPMNELRPAFCVPSIATAPHHEGTLHTVSALDVAKMVKHVMGLSASEVDQLSLNARAAYQRDVQQFYHALDELVGGR